MALKLVSGNKARRDYAILLAFDHFALDSNVRLKVTDVTGQMTVNVVKTHFHSNRLRFYH